MNPELEKIIKQLQQIREEKKITRAVLAEAFGMNEQLLVLIELGEIVPSPKQREAMEEYVLDQI